MSTPNFKIYNVSYLLQDDSDGNSPYEWFTNLSELLPAEFERVQKSYGNDRRESTIIGTFHGAKYDLHALHSPGYYAHAILDFVIEGEEGELGKGNIPHGLKTAVKKLLECYKNISTREIRHVATLSNGEAIYE